jgi:hypothetical protein
MIGYVYDSIKVLWQTKIIGMLLQEWIYRFYLKTV